MSERLGFAASLHLLHTEGTMNNGMMMEMEMEMGNNGNNDDSNNDD